LGHAEILRVKQAPRGCALGSDADAGGSPAILRDGRTEAGEFPEDDGEVLAGVVIVSIIAVCICIALERRARGRLGGQQTSDVLEQNPLGSERINDAYELEEKSGSRAVQSSTASSHANVLAGESSGDHIDICGWPPLVSSGELTDITVSDDMREPPVEHLVAELVDLHLSENAHPGAL
jgi:hypothetical protein